MDESSEKLTASAVSFVTSMRLGKGFDEKSFADLISLLRAFNDRWRTAEMLPKSAVLTLLDLPRMIEACAPLYEGEERQRIVAASHEIVDVILEGL